MTGREPQRGTALTSTLAATAVLLPLAAFTALLARTDFYIHHNTRAQSEVFYAAEAGLEHALADIPPSVTPPQLLYGPDGQSGTADDGVFPFQEGSPGFFPYAPLRYEVRIEQASAALLRLTATGFGVRNTRAVIEALVGRDPAAYVPAAVYAPNLSGLTLGAAALVSGLDHHPADAPDQPTGGAPAVYGLGLGSAEAVAAVLAQLAPGTGARLLGKQGPPSVAAVQPIDVPGLIGALAAAPGATMMSSGALSAPAQLGTIAAPQLTVVLDGGEITGAINGAGVLIAPAGLRVSGQLTFNGLVLVAGEARFAAASSVRVDGAMWLGPDALLAHEGNGAITYDRGLIDAVDQQFANCLPHAMIIKAWREVL